MMSIRNALNPTFGAFAALYTVMLAMPAMLLAGAALAQEPGGGGQEGGGQPGGGGGGGQEGGGLDVDVRISDEPEGTVWYGQWWIWAVGIGIFLILVIALTRGKSSA